MRIGIVFTLTGPDKVGIVREVTEVLLGLGANVETSRMARLGGEFAMLMLALMPEKRMDEIDGAFAGLVEQGYKVTTSRTLETGTSTFLGWLPYRIEVQGADHEGIIHEIVAGLAKRGINIESMETGTSPAPISGTPLFMMSALVMVPPGLADVDWTATIAESAAQANVDVEIALADR